MVEDSKRRGRPQRGGSMAAGKGRQAHGTAVAAADQDAFAAFTTTYRDMLRFADADEAEAVYSMVSLTQAAHKQQQQQQAELIKGPVIEVAERRAVKRRPVPLALPAASACSDGGRSDSSAKSAPGPTQRLHQQHWQHASMQAAQHGPSMLAAALRPPAACAGQAGTMQQQPQAAACNAEGTDTSDGPDPAAADIHPGALGPMGAAAGMHGMPAGCMNMSMPMDAAPWAFPPGCMPGMMMGGAPGCPPPFMPPFMPPWGFNPAMMQSMMMRGLPMPPLPMPPPGMMPMPFMPGFPGMMGPAGQQQPAAAEPAAGIPVTGPLPPAGNAFKATAMAQKGFSPAGPNSSGPASKGASALVAADAGMAPPAWTQQQQAAPSTPGGAAGAATQLRAGNQQQRTGMAAPAVSPSLSPSAARAAAAPAAVGSSAAAAAGPSGDVLAELEQLDLVALKPWVVTQFCEDVYLLLLDVWRPDSAKIREAIWAWKLHLKGPMASGAQPDYRAFLVSLFGLERLTQLTAAAAAARQGSSTLAKAASAAPIAAGPLGAAAQDAAVGAAVESCMGFLAAPAAAVEAMTPEHEAPCAVYCDAAVTTSNLSSEPGAAMTAPGPHVMAILVPDRKAGGASATSPHRAQPQEQLQHLL